MECFYCVLLLSMCLCFVRSICPPRNRSEAISYVEIPEGSYDRTYSSITSVGKHPLGFYKETWYFNQESNPCVHISGASNRRLEIMFETTPNARLCVKDQTSAATCSDASTGRFYSCNRAKSDDVYLEFFCDQGEEYDVRFWYRVVLGDLPADDPEDYWCDRDDRPIEYPSDLVQLPADYPLHVSTTGSPDSALGLRSSVVMIGLLFGAVMYMI